MNFEEFNLRLYNKNYIYIYITFRLLNLYKVYNLLDVAEKNGVGTGVRKKTPGCLEQHETTQQLSSSQAF